MKMFAMFISLLKISLSVMFLMALETAAAQKQLTMGFYMKSCPSAERIVRNTVSQAVATNPGLGAGLIRLFFHDCFVRGCDASILLKQTATSESEQDAPPNAGSLRGLEIIDQAKRKIEAACPNTVSCADILAFAARDSTNILGGSSFAIPSGRRDGRISSIEDVDLPSPDSSLNGLTKAFAARGMSVNDLVVLSGAHSIGHANCDFVASRLYFFNTTTETDPSLDLTYAAFLKKKCPKGSQSRFANLDPLTPTRLDNQYYRNVRQHKGMFTSDQALLGSSFTAKIVGKYGNDPAEFARDFAAAMVRLGSLNVLTGTQGEIRRVCSVRN